MSPDGDRPKVPLAELGPVGSRRERGAFVVIVGPDGVGKTTVAHHLMALRPGRAAYFHFRPPISSKFWSEPPQNELIRTKSPTSGTRIMGWTRIFWSLLVFWAGYLLRVNPATRKGWLIVGDRWGYGYMAQPQGLKFYGPERLASWVVRRLPQPTLVANLIAAPEVISARKQELTAAQLGDEMKRWGELPVSRMRTFDATGAPAEIALQIYSAVCDDASI